MMLDKRLLNQVPKSKQYIAFNVLFQWIKLVANITMMFSVTKLLSALYNGTCTDALLRNTAITIIVVILVEAICIFLSQKMSYLSSKSVKRVLREKIYNKLLRLGTGYRKDVETSEIVQVAVEGVDQLETYFGAYVPQFFYAMLAPLTLFIVLCFVNVPSAVVLLICVPLIPVSIALVQTWAKKLLSKYWGQYTSLGDTFLENLQGLTTLKIYQSDAYKNEEMNKESEAFRKITMKVLTMQLNSITIMDLIAYGGSALGIIMALTQFQKGNVTLQGTLLIILLSADFFLPMRQLGSYFHIAMNGMAASDKIFRLLDLEENDETDAVNFTNGDIRFSNLTFAYDQSRTILKDISLTIPKNGFVSIVGKSGSGKSTIAHLLMGRYKTYTGSITVNDTELKTIKEEELMRHFTYIGQQSFLFKGTVRDNLLAGDPSATDEMLWEALEEVRLRDFLKAENGLDTPLNEQAANLSGGQRQRLALARALLHDSDIYIFDEATSNIDMESENAIMEEIEHLSKTKTVILISHRLKNVIHSDKIYVLSQGQITEEGTHEELLAVNGGYANLYKTQTKLEDYGKEVIA